MRITKENKKSLAQDLGAELAAKNSFFASFNGMKFQQANGLSWLIKIHVCTKRKLHLMGMLVQNDGAN